MSSLCVVSGSGMLLNRYNKMNVQCKEHTFVRTHSVSGFSSSPCYYCSVSFRPTCSSKGSYLFCNQNFSMCDFNGSCRGRIIRMEKLGNNFVKRTFSLRLRPRLWLFSVRLRRFSVRALLNDLKTFVRKNVKGLTISASFILIIGLCYCILNLTALPSPKIMPYSDLVMSLQKGCVSEVLFEEGSRRIYYNMHSQAPSKVETLDTESSSMMVDSTNKNAATPRKSKYLNLLRKLLMIRSSTPEWQYFTRKIDHNENFILSLMRDTEATYSSAPPSVIMSLRGILVTILTLWIPLIPLMWLLYHQFSSANSLARKRKPTSQDVNFDDVEGVDGAKVELMEIILCLQGVRNYNKLGAKLPTGVLLIGPPGTGKTLLARAIAGEAGVPFFPVSASEFVELFVGRGAARIRDLFCIARKSAPSIIFIDELDAVGGKRGRSFNDERDQTLNQLLTEMDGFETNMNVVVIAATNRPEALDPALCRPGRFSRKVLVGEPDEEGRKKILNVHFKGVALEEETTQICNFIASLTQGFVGADLANVVNEGALLAARRGGESVSREDLLEAIERGKNGINFAQPTQSMISKEIGKLFPWMPSLLRKTEPRLDGVHGLSGYQSLS